MSFSLSGTFLKNFILLSILFLFFGCSSSRYSEKKEDINLLTPQVRILLNEPSKSLQLKIEDDISIYSGEKEINKKAGKGDQLVFENDNGLTLISGRTKYKSDNFKIKPYKDFSFNDKKISGDIRVVSDGKMVYLINSITVEEYLKGVIPSEMPLGRGTEYFEALKAFAICARTYTFQRISSGNNIFDVRTDVRDQVYGGAGRQSEISNRAVDETRGMILTYDGEPAIVFYSSTCSGRTEDIENVFGSVKYPYLQSIKDGNEPYCSASPRAEWEENFTGERIVELLIKSGRLKKDIYTLNDIKINSRFRSGRVNELEIDFRNKGGIVPVKLYGNSIRFVLLTSGNRTLNSNNFEIIKKEDQIIFKGKGSGHGVGLCQWGALIQSTKGILAADILDHYFPGTAITRNYD